MSDDDGEFLTVNDLITRAILEPTITDVYVEGRRDADILRLVLAAEGVDAEVFAVNDRLTVPREDVVPFAEEYGNRAKLQAVAGTLDLALGADRHSYSFLIDSDWALVKGPVPLPSSSLILTDLPSMEHHFIESVSFGKTLRLGFERANAEANEVRSALRGALQDVAAARLVLEDLNVSCIDSFPALCIFSGSKSSADSMEIIRRSLNAAGRGSEISTSRLSERLATYKEWIETSSHPGRGHDIAPLLIRYLKLKNAFASKSVVEVVLRTGMELHEFLPLRMIQRVVERSSGRSEAA
jgi:hypothetical protein